MVGRIVLAWQLPPVIIRVVIGQISPSMLMSMDGSGCVVSVMQPADVVYACRVLGPATVVVQSLQHAGQDHTP
jgi:hypothetical protein